MTIHDVTETALKLVRSYTGSSLLVNHPPGAGNTYLLNKLAQGVRELWTGCVIIGPVALKQLEPNEMIQAVFSALDDQYHLNVTPPPNFGNNLLDAWQWVAENSDLSSHHAVFVLFALPDEESQDINNLGLLFSQARTFEANNPCTARICHVFAGSWDHPQLQEYYDQINTTPQSTEHYQFWPGVTINELQSLLNADQPTRFNDLHVRTIHELTSGSLDVVNEIIALIDLDQTISVTVLMDLVRQAATNGSVTQRLVQHWQKLPNDSKAYLPILLLQRFIRAPLILPTALERLRLAGLISENRCDGQNYLGFRSWYIDLVVRFNCEQLGIANDQVNKIRVEELIPMTSEICVQSYRILNQIENLVRNFVSTHLWQEHSEGDWHPLAGKVIRFNSFKGTDEDALERAEDWRRRNEKRDITSTSLNPLIAYLSTNDLAILVKETGLQLDAEEWRDIGNMLDDLSGVRDAIMHNQLIDDSDLEKLYVLRVKIFDALSRR